MSAPACVMPTPICVVCAAPLLRSGARAAIVPGSMADLYPACQAVACRMVVSRRAEMGEAGFRHYLRLQAAQTQGRQQRNLESAARRQRHEQENASGWRALQAGLPAAAGEPLRLLLPTGPRRARKVSAARRARYLAHLETIVAEARLPAAEVESAPPPAAPVSTAPPELAERAAASAMPGRLCGMCGGGCCTRGGEHAYLTAATVRALREQQPDLSEAAIVQTYLDLLPPKSQGDSCINHTSAGCALPRELRSTTCNRYACEALARLQHAQRWNAQLSTVIVIQRQLDNWRKSAMDRDDPVTGYGVLTEQRLRRIGLTRLAPVVVASPAALPSDAGP